MDSTGSAQQRQLEQQQLHGLVLRSRHELLSGRGPLCILEVVVRAPPLTFNCGACPTAGACASATAAATPGGRRRRSHSAQSAGRSATLPVTELLPWVPADPECQSSSPSTGVRGGG